MRPLSLRAVSSLLLLVALLAGCAQSVAPPATPAASPAPNRTLTVFAAASLKESFTEIGALFESAHPGVTVVFNFAGSQQLRAQLEQGAPADIFASANSKEMNAAIESSLVAANSEQVFARNRLVMIYPVGNPGDVTALADLARPGLKLVVADEKVPVGQYTRAMLDKMSEDAAYGVDFAARAGKNVVSLEQDVKAVVTKVQLGEADAGIVYATDAAAAGNSVVALQVPALFNQPAAYPIAALAGAPNAELAQKFVDLALSEQGQAALRRHGFLPPEP